MLQITEKPTSLHSSKSPFILLSQSKDINEILAELIIQPGKKNLQIFV